MVNVRAGVSFEASSRSTVFGTTFLAVSQLSGSRDFVPLTVSQNSPRHLQGLGAGEESISQLQILPHESSVRYCSVVLWTAYSTFVKNASFNALSIPSHTICSVGN